MGKRLIPQRRGRGTPRYTAPSHRFKGAVKYPRMKNPISWQVIDLVKDAIHTSPVAKVLLEDFTETKIIATEGIGVGSWIHFGGAQNTPGSVCSIGVLPEGTEICNIEACPGDGGKLVRSSGASASIVSHDRRLNITYILLPSRKTMTINSNSKATVGRIAGGGRIDKPFARAGQVHHKYTAISRLYPRVSGSKMNACNHPHGGGYKRIRPTSVARSTPPGAKAGHIAPKRTGRKKR